MHDGIDRADELCLLGAFVQERDHFLLVRHGDVHALATARAKLRHRLGEAIKRRFDRLLRIGYTHTEMVDSVDEIQHPSVRACLKFMELERGVDILGISPQETVTQDYAELVSAS